MEVQSVFGDLIQAGKVAASELLQRKCDLLVNPKPMVPSWTEAGARLLVARNFKRYMTIGNVRWGLYELVHYTIFDNDPHFISLYTAYWNKEALRLVLVEHVKDAL